ncbi:MAG: hypothetical protein ACRDQD_16760, partial [Nocardioidaceae bacterium]
TGQSDPKPPASEQPAPVPTSRDGGAELNLLTTVGPALLKRYAVPAIGLLVVFLVLRKLLRR